VRVADRTTAVVQHRPQQSRYSRRIAVCHRRRARHTGRYPAAAPHRSVCVKLFVGLILLLWCPTMLVSRRLPHVTGGGRFADGTMGWIGGVRGGLGGLTGPAPTLWCALRGWGRDKQRAVFQTFNLTMQMITMVAYIATGTISRDAAVLC